MLTRDMLQMLRMLKVEARKKADALEKLADQAEEWWIEECDNPDGYSVAIDEVRDIAGDMDNFAEDIATLLEDYEAMLIQTAGKANTLIERYLYPEDFKNIVTRKKHISKSFIHSNRLSVWTACFIFAENNFTALRPLGFLRLPARAFLRILRP